MEEACEPAQAELLSERAAQEARRDYTFLQKPEDLLCEDKRQPWIPPRVGRAGVPEHRVPSEAIRASCPVRGSQTTDPG